MRHLPNLLSFGRIVLTPFLCSAIWDREYELALVFCFVAGVTDALDGFLARRFQASSKIGMFLDPIADKILLTSAFLTLAADRAIPWWLAGLVVGRDVMILSFAAWAFRNTNRRSFPPSVWGKLSTIIQIFFVLAVIVHAGGYGDADTTRVMTWLTAAATTWSGIDYGRTGWQIAQSRVREPVID